MPLEARTGKFGGSRYSGGITKSDQASEILPVHVLFPMMPRTTFPLVVLGAGVLLAATNSPSGAALPTPVAPAHALSVSRSVPSSGRSFHRLPAPGERRLALAGAVTRRDSTPLYTEEQATAGAALFGKVCAECHEKKDIAGNDFRAKWNGRTLYDLFELVRTTMPDSDPGKYSRDEYAGAMAYILKQNGLPSGPAAIMPDSAAMSAVKLELPPQAPSQSR